MYLCFKPYLCTTHPAKIFTGISQGGSIDYFVTSCYYENYIMPKATEVLQLRAHHICCTQFWQTAFEGRGSDFVRVQNRIKSILLSQPDSLIMVSEGIDELCRQCSYCVDERCTSPQGNEDEVRKWDAILLKEVGLSFGVCLTSGEWQALIKQKVPFKLCQRCRWKQVCSVGAALL